MAALVAKAKRNFQATGSSCENGHNVWRRSRADIDIGGRRENDKAGLEWARSYANGFCI